MVVVAGFCGLGLGFRNEGPVEVCRSRLGAYSLGNSRST